MSQGAPPSPITSGCLPISVCGGRGGGGGGDWGVMDFSLEIMTNGPHVAQEYTCDTVM